jgi:hypothetical protein
LPVIDFDRVAAVVEPPIDAEADLERRDGADAGMKINRALMPYVWGWISSGRK